MRWALAPLLLLLFAGAAVAAAAPPSETAFTEEMAARFRTALPRSEVQVTAPLQLRISAPTYREPPAVVLDRTWNVCRPGPSEECEEAKARFVAALVEIIAEHPPVARAQLRVMVRSADYCAAARERASRENQTVVMRPGPAALCTLVVADYPSSMRLLNGRDLGQLGLGADEVWPIAERQTMASLPQPQSLAELDQHSPATVVGRDYIPSLLLNAEGWRAVAARGDVLVAVPEDGALIAIRAADVADLAAFRAIVRDHHRLAERGISPEIYRWTDEGWVAIP
jgi:hypothetical protein